MEDSLLGERCRYIGAFNLQHIRRASSSSDAPGYMACRSVPPRAGAKVPIRFKVGQPQIADGTWTRETRGNGYIAEVCRPPFSPKHPLIFPPLPNDRQRLRVREPFTMADRHDENLPEVVPDSSPQTLTSAEVFDRRGLDEGDAKFTVVNDQSNPKMASADVFMGDAETPTTPAPAYRPYAVGAAGGGAAGTVAPGSSNPGNTEADLGNEKAKPRILGLKKRTFIIVLVVAIVIIAAAIGGGVGGSQAAKKSGNSAEDSAGAEQETL